MLQHSTAVYSFSYGSWLQLAVIRVSDTVKLLYIYTYIPRNAPTSRPESTLLNQKQKWQKIRNQIAIPKSAAPIAARSSKLRRQNVVTTRLNITRYCWFTPVRSVRRITRPPRRGNATYCLTPGVGHETTAECEGQSREETLG